ncbi:hypothetical protein CR513_07316, partial [Mucuna pruriens]
MKKSLPDRNKPCKVLRPQNFLYSMHCASINVMLSSIYGSLNFGDPEPTGICCATLRYSQGCISPSQRIDFSSRLLCVGYGGRNVWERINLDFGMTISNDHANENRCACRDPFNGIR